MNKFLLTFFVILTASSFFVSDLNISNRVIYTDDLITERYEGHISEAESTKWKDSEESLYRKSLIGHAVKTSEDLVILLRANKNIRKLEGGVVGSGVIVGHINGKTLILTANHVCDNFDSGEVIPSIGMVISSKQFIITVDGEKLEMHKLYALPESDVCSVYVDKIIGVPAPVSNENPPIGSTVATAGAPAGVWDGVVTVVEGVYMGIRKKNVGPKKKGHTNFNQYSIPVVGGQSGSGVFYKGEVVGIVTHVLTKYPHVSWGPQAHKLRAITDLSIKRLYNI